MEVQELQPAAEKKSTITPKVLIYQRYGPKACYTIEEVQQSVDNACPGLIIPQQSQSLYRCCLVLPELSVSSDTFTKKKDAEQSAAKMAVEKLGILSKPTDLTPHEAWNELVARFSILFSDEFLSSSHPLVGHFSVGFRRVGNVYSMIPLSVIAACDVKVNNLCKIIDPKAEMDPLLVFSFIWKAARMSDSICTATAGGFWIWKQGPYSPEVLELFMNRDLGSIDTVQIEALRIPHSIEGHIETFSLDISVNQYYMDQIALKLDARDASQLLVSRTFGKASSEMRLYFSVPESALTSSDSSVDLCSNMDGNASLESLLNKQASYLSGQAIYGDAILVNVGYSRKSPGLFYENVNLCTYYRILLGKVPDGHYKLSREAILVAELPTAFTARSNWKGPLPRDLLCVFCRQQRLLEPIFSVQGIDSSETAKEEDCKKMKLSNPATFKCEVKILSRRREIVLECSSGNTYKKEFDAIQNVALEVLTWFNKYFKQLDMHIDKVPSFGLAHNVRIHPVNFSREFAMLVSIYQAKQHYHVVKCSSLGPVYKDQPELKQDNGMILENVEGDDSGVFPSHGSLTCINYDITLRKKEASIKYLIESKDEFEFEIGTGSVVNQLETCVSQLSVNQSACFTTSLPSRDLLLASAGESTENLANMSLSNCFLEFSLKLLRVSEPMEERLEQALFSPPLSKQRVEFAVRHINESNLASLVDFGCGSGSLLDSLLEHSTTLERIVGVDISCKALTRAAKIIHSKLSNNSVLQDNIKSVVLYDGSITVFDSRLYGFDIGTCLEVIEHMEEDQACLFGDVVLSSFCPQVLIISTPNYEYNPILQKSSLPNKEEDSEDKSLATCRFRNHDHKFEWTRQQFEHWATDLAVRHNYSVEFSGVGGFGDVEPGFASQIAVFKSGLNRAEEKCLESREPACPYRLIWEWNHCFSSTI